MSDNNTAKTMEEEYSPDTSNAKKWSDFVETTALDFFAANKLEKISLEDGQGNKAKMIRTKDNDIKLEYSTTKLL
ncbi:MAG: hypothetical protein FWH04_02740 [Oscillospiraceae bacterium]|nr:hypothetical protein [Oscillospiraceae bacterium]